VALWKKTLPVEALNAMCRGTIHDALGIRFSELSEDRLVATMPVTDATRQPFGLLHGGASVVLAESLGSMAAHLACEDGEVPVGIEVNANHLRPVREGTVVGTTRPVHLGRSLHVWGVEIADEAGKPVCVARLTVMIRVREARPT
jgi:1,4-dihydroxy-2-naphthoyl-CoA hydrolase